jgi:hypothetical protein
VLKILRTAGISLISISMISAFWFLLTFFVGKSLQAHNQEDEGVFRFILNGEIQGSETPIDKLAPCCFCARLFFLERIISVDLTDRLKTDRYLGQNGKVVFTERFPINRGVCCGLGCTHCPYYRVYA